MKKLTFINTVLIFGVENEIESSDVTLDFSFTLPLLLSPRKVFEILSANFRRLDVVSCPLSVNREYVELVSSVKEGEGGLV
uniref:Uncharacterized protein n=1 Tax=Panagrolaimus davidi TaxID=227884 RepID=A0A914Q6J8_9BILA